MNVIVESEVDSARGHGGRSMVCCQVAVSTTDIARTHWWYRHALGFRTAGERRHREGAQFATVPGLPEASFDVWCLVGTQPFFQFELFEFERPRMRPLAADRRPCDIGYSMVGIVVPDLEAAMERLDRVGGAPLTTPIGETGARRVCVRDPDGILLELREDPVYDDLPRQDGPVVASVTASVRSLEKVREFWVDVLGLQEGSDTGVHTSRHEELWHLGGATRESLVVRAGDIAIELVQYGSPLGKPRPAGYLISDQGLLNIAFGSTERSDFDAVYQRAVEAGFEGHTKPWTVPGVATVVYLQDPQGLSVELLHVEPAALDRMGFVAAPSTASQLAS